MNTPQSTIPPRGRSNATYAALARGFESLRVRNFRLFWTGQVISLTGTWMQITAQAWLVLQLAHDSPFALGMVVTLQYIPVMLLALFGGVLADSLPKRPALVATQTLLMVQASVFSVLVATGAIQLWHIYVLAAIQGLITAVDNPVRQAFVFEMVGRDNVVNAVALNSMSFQGARIFGPALAGVVIKLIGIAPTLIVNAVSFVPVIWALLLLDSKAFFALPPNRSGSMIRRLKDGVAFASHTPIVLSTLIVAGFIGTFGFNFSVIVPLVADNVLKTDATGYGFLSAAMGVGALVAALGAAYVRELTVRRLLISGALFGVFLGALGVSTSFGLSAFILIIVGMTGITCTTAANSLLQLNTPEELRGRVLSINTLLMLGSTPIGGFFLGSVGQLAGVETAILLCAGLCLLGIGIAFSYRRRVGGSAPMAA